MKMSLPVMTVRLKNVLEYYDGPILMTVVDSVDTIYICQLIDRATEFDEFFCVPVSQSSLELFYLGRIDLRDIFIKPEKRYFSLVKVVNYEEPMDFESIAEEDIASEWYPDIGFKLTAYPKLTAYSAQLGALKSM